MQAAKQEAINIIDRMPDDSDMDEIMYRLYVLDKIRKGQQAVEQGKTITSEELQREIDSWWDGPNRPYSLQSIHDFIAHDSRYYAKKVTQDIRDKADILDELPKIGQRMR